MLQHRSLPPPHPLLVRLFPSSSCMQGSIQFHFPGALHPLTHSSLYCVPSRVPSTCWCYTSFSLDSELHLRAGPQATVPHLLHRFPFVKTLLCIPNFISTCCTGKAHLSIPQLPKLTTLCMTSCRNTPTLSTAFKFPSFSSLTRLHSLAITGSTVIEEDRCMLVAALPRLPALRSIHFSVNQMQVCLFLTRTEQRHHLINSTVMHSLSSACTPCLS